MFRVKAFVKFEGPIRNDVTFYLVLLVGLYNVKSM